MAKNAAIPLRQAPAKFPSQESDQDKATTELVKMLARTAARMDYKRLK